MRRLRSSCGRGRLRSRSTSRSSARSVCATSTRCASRPTTRAGAYARALQRLGWDAVLPAMREWASGSLLERRAVVGGLCEPALLDSEARAVVALGLLDEITDALTREPDRRTDEFKALRKALGYGWSVAVAAAPSEGRRVMGRWLESDDRDVAWVMRENLKKKRLSGVF